MMICGALLLWCFIVATAATADRWYENEPHWSSSPVARALEERKKRGSSEWSGVVQAQLNRLEDDEAERRIACFTAAQNRAVAASRRPHHHRSSPSLFFRVVLISGSTVLGSISESGGGRRVGLSDLILDIALCKKAYARRHGYAFEYFSAEAFLDELEAARLPRWEFAKTFMLRAAWAKHREGSSGEGAEAKKTTVLLWSDYDVWLNPRHAGLPATDLSLIHI